jgi:hypothetical protein
VREVKCAWTWIILSTRIRTEPLSIYTQQSTGARMRGMGVGVSVSVCFWSVRGQHNKAQEASRATDRNRRSGNSTHHFRQNIICGLQGEKPVHACPRQTIKQRQDTTQRGVMKKATRAPRVTARLGHRQHVLALTGVHVRDGHRGKLLQQGLHPLLAVHLTGTRHRRVYS